MSLSLKAVSADGYYQPADFDASKHGTLNRINKTHRLGRRKRPDGTVVVRFEMPYKVWCLNCNEILAKGVRFDARKKQAGSLGPGCPIFEFYMTCLFCKNPITIKTDPESTEYICVEGCRPRIEHWSERAEEEETIHDATGCAPTSPEPESHRGTTVDDHRDVDSRDVDSRDVYSRDVDSRDVDSRDVYPHVYRQVDFRSVAELKELDDNPLIRRQVRKHDQDRHRNNFERLRSIKLLSDRAGQDDALNNAALRNAYRTKGGLTTTAEDNALVKDKVLAGRGSKAGAFNPNFVLPVLALTENEQAAARATLDKYRSKKPPKDRVKTLKSKLKKHLAM
ncbi:hypothetical protein GNI_065270 [Gregarina niphandrodes]|uniref:Uncharacterized protein n=1 Tax=Gregarina niphandrodes TaxID=110365 RepID=A0A023B809_GRENI|nr:hypothetical protein GNI_065270 [Gregarina niphandrodes]EZG67980.1 hypothetical protein GNI_065270 [Gregarina niphandrodes]|eukprot:XP_011130129.1 hypothetical protein GNI_065270 [Gregarina niphandrodes]